MAQTITIDGLFANWLAALPDVVGLAGGRVYPWGEAPQAGEDRFPCLLYARVGGDRLRSTKGPTTRVARPKFQLDAVARTYREAKLLGDAVALALEASLPGTSLDGHKVQSCRAKMPRDVPGDPVFGDERAEPRCLVECEIWFEEG